MVISCFASHDYCIRKSQNMPLNNLNPFCLCLFLTLNFCFFRIDVPSSLSDFTGLAFPYLTSDCCLPYCSDLFFLSIRFLFPIFQTPEHNTSSSFHEPSFPSINCPAKEVVATVYWCCVLVGDFSLFFSLSSSSCATHPLCCQVQSKRNPRGEEWWITSHEKRLNVGLSSMHTEST